MINYWLQITTLLIILFMGFTGFTQGFENNEAALAFIQENYACDDPENMKCTLNINLNTGTVNQRTTFIEESSVEQKEYLRALKLKEMIIRKGAVGYGEAVIMSCNNCINVTVNTTANNKTSTQHFMGKNLYFRPSNANNVDQIVAALKYLQAHIVPSTNLEAPVIQEKWGQYLSEKQERKFTFWKFFQFHGMSATNIETSFKYQGAKPVTPPCDRPAGSQISMQFADIYQSDSGPVKFLFTFGFPYSSGEPCEQQLNGQCDFVAIELSGPQDQVLEVLAQQYLWNNKQYEAKKSFDLINVGTEMIKGSAAWQKSTREKYFLEVVKKVGEDLNVKFLRY